MVQTANEAIAENDRIYEINFTQAERPVYFMRINGYTFGGALGGLGLEGEGQIIPAVIPVTERMTAAECYMHIEASPEVAWSMVVSKNGEQCYTQNASGEGTPEHDPWWRPTDNVEPTEIEYMVVFKTENEYVPEDEREIILKFKQAAAEGVLFEVTKWDLGGFGVVNEGDVLACDLTGEFYPNIRAASTVAWVMNVYKNGELFGTPFEGAGTYNPYFILPANDTTEDISWRIEIKTENTEVAQQVHELNFTQAGTSTIVYSAFEFTHIEGAYTFYPNQENNLPAFVNANGKQDLYAKINTTSNVTWTYSVTRNGEIWTDVQDKGGEVTGTGDFFFYVTNNDSSSEVTWVVTVSTTAAVENPTQSITIVQTGI